MKSIEQTPQQQAEYGLYSEWLLTDTDLTFEEWMAE
tara:strand:- start:22 stop:129 length:108 start_codon:yes stop_codon:yes gene_type:complete